MSLSIEFNSTESLHPPEYQMTADLLRYAIKETLLSFKQKRYYAIPIFYDLHTEQSASYTNTREDYGNLLLLIIKGLGSYK